MKLIAKKNINAVIVFSDGSYFFGKGIGILGEVIGEVCFNTAITGYQEVLTDHSYAGQVIVFAFPHIGNVGCNNDDGEAHKPYCKGLVIRNDITQDSNFRSNGSLESWLVDNGLTGICDVDTRNITKNIRNNGARNVIISFVKEGEEIDTDLLISKIVNLPTLKGVELASEASRDKSDIWEKKTYDFLQQKYPKLQDNEKKYKVVVVDYGIKRNILRCLADCGFDIRIVPAKSSYQEILSLNPDGIFLSNGPGDPHETAKYAVSVIKKLFDTNIPMFGICMGHQLISIAANLTTIKMHQGHRGINHPVKNLNDGTVEITSQNHGFCASKENIPDNVKVSHVSLFDDTIQGIEIKGKPIFSVQYHPESSPGPHDSKYLFQKFLKLIKEYKCQK